jgi:hypothetical protein
MREEAHGEHFLTVVMDGSDQTKIVGDVENGYRTIAFDRHLIGVSKSPSGFTEILPAGGFGYPIPMVKRGTRFGVSLFGGIEKLSGDDPHVDLSRVAKMTTFVKTGFAWVQATLLPGSSRCWVPSDGQQAPWAPV